MTLKLRRAAGGHRRGWRRRLSTLDSQRSSDELPSLLRDLATDHRGHRHARRAAPRRASRYAHRSRRRLDTSGAAGDDDDPILERVEIEQFRAIVARRLGLHYEDGEARLPRRCPAPTYGDRWVAPASSPTSSIEFIAKGSEEFRALAEQLTVNETFFFRNADNFRAFAEVVLPDRIRRSPGTKRLRILSAGCASGEEAYSLAILVREALPDLASWDVKIVGIDINPAMLAKATQARYSAWSLRATPEDAKRRYFRADGRDFVLDPAIQKMVTFEERNLVEEDPRSGSRSPATSSSVATFSCTSLRTKRVTSCAESVRPASERILVPRARGNPSGTHAGLPSLPYPRHVLLPAA